MLSDREKFLSNLSKIIDVQNYTETFETNLNKGE